MKKIIFVAGPVRGDGSIEAKENNIENARKYVRILIENKIPFYSPHLNIDMEAIYLGEDAGKFSWDTNAEFLLRCDAIAVLPGWEASSGTKEEIENATRKNMPVFYLDEDGFVEKILEWLAKE